MNHNFYLDQPTIPSGGQPHFFNPQQIAQPRMSHPPPRNPSGIGWPNTGYYPVQPQQPGMVQQNMAPSFPPNQSPSLPGRDQPQSFDPRRVTQPTKSHPQPQNASYIGPNTGYHPVQQPGMAQQNLAPSFPPNHLPQGPCPGYYPAPTPQVIPYTYPPLPDHFSHPQQNMGYNPQPNHIAPVVNMGSPLTMASSNVRQQSMAPPAPSNLSWQQNMDLSAHPVLPRQEPYAAQAVQGPPRMDYQIIVSSLHANPQRSNTSQLRVLAPNPAPIHHQQNIAPSPSFSILPGHPYPPRLYPSQSYSPQPQSSPRAAVKPKVSRQKPKQPRKPKQPPLQNNSPLPKEAMEARAGQSLTIVKKSSQLQDVAPSSCSNPSVASCSELTHTPEQPPESSSLQPTLALDPEASQPQEKAPSILENPPQDIPAAIEPEVHQSKLPLTPKQQRELESKRAFQKIIEERKAGMARVKASKERQAEVKRLQAAKYCEAIDPPAVDRESLLDPFSSILLLEPFLDWESLRDSFNLIPSLDTFLKQKAVDVEEVCKEHGHGEGNLWCSKTCEGWKEGSESEEHEWRALCFMPTVLSPQRSGARKRRKTNSDSSSSTTTALVTPS